MNTKKLLSAAAAVAVMTSGAMAFDFTTDGEIIADVTTATGKKDATQGITGTYASYVRGTEATADLNLSANNKGDALIYPAFKAGDGWSSKLAVRNAENNATVCKVVLYAADNSRELLDFDIYLSPYDVFTFNIDKDGKVTTNDGSFALVDPTLRTDQYRFVKHNEETVEIGNITSRKGNEKVTSGYAIIYAMVEAKNDGPNEMQDGHGAYHGKHGKLFEDFRKVVDICRDTDNDITTTATWRTVLGNNSANIQNGTAVGSTKVVAPDVNSTCVTEAINRNDNNATLKLVNSMDSNFTSPSSDLIFGDVTITKDDNNPRNLLINAKALDNYTTSNQMMLWVPGEYAAIQDRRITSGINNGNAATNTYGYASSTRATYSDYNLTGIVADANTFNIKQVYYTFDANKMKGANTLLVTQPMKRALVMGGDTASYWTASSPAKVAYNNTWGAFTIISNYYNENENLDQAAVTLQVVTSPVSGNPADAYKNELQIINDPERTETSSELFKKSEEAGFAIMNLGATNQGIPAIISQMVGSVINGHGQTNWIYSTTDK